MRIFPTGSYLVRFLIASALIALSAYETRIFAQQPAAAPEKLRPDPDAPRTASAPEGEDENDLLLPLKRDQWFYQQRAFPNKRTPPEAYWHSQMQRETLLAAGRTRLANLRPEQAAAVDPLSTLRWIADGPQPVAAYGGSIPYSGRADAIAVHPTDPATVYLGTAAGGVWKTTNGGQTWTPLTDSQASLAIGALAIDPNNPETVYAGTGEPDYSGDSYYGQGLLKSTNGGQSWTLIRNPFPNPYAPGVVGATITSIAVQKGNSNVVLVGTFYGLYRSGDGGSTWTEIINTGVSAILFDRKKNNTVYVGVGDFPSTGTLFVSTDAGQTFKTMNGTGANSVPAPSAVLRTALAEDASGTLYAAFARSDYGAPGSLYKSSDGGQNWIKLTAPNSLDWYRNAIAVVPSNPKVMYASGASLWESTDGGNTWTAVGGQSYADQHAFAFSADGSLLYLADDGGVFVNTDPAAAFASFTSLNETINTLTFYPGFSILAGNSKSALAGSQDHGVNLYLGELAWPNGEQSGFCGDGGSVYIDPKGMSAYAHCEGGSANWVSNATGGKESTAWVAAEDGISTQDRWPFVADIKGDFRNVSTVYTGTNRLYRSTNSGALWTPISPDLTDGGTISTIGVSPFDSNTLYVGSNDGKLSVTHNAAAGDSATWTTLAGLPPRNISKVIVNSNDDDIYVTVGGFSSGHVFHSTDGGATFTDVSGNLPDTPVDSIAVDPDIRTTIYLATDTGVYVSETGGNSWTPLGGGLPNVVVQDILVVHSTRTVRVVTHGRGAWDAALTQVIPAGITFNPAYIDSPAVVTLTVSLNRPAPFGGASVALKSSNPAVFPVPATFQIKAGSTKGMLTIHTAQIKAVETAAITASYSGATIGASVSLNPGSFSLSANTRTAAVVQGKSIEFKAKIQSLNNFSGKVALAASGLPQSISAAGSKWSPSSVTVAAGGYATATYTLATTAKTIPGKYNLQFVASSPRYVKQIASLALTVTEAPAPKISGILSAPLKALTTAQTLEIGGSNFAAGDTLTFTPPKGAAFASIAAQLTVVSATEITYKLNVKGMAGEWSVRVNSADGLRHSNLVVFTVK